MEIPYENEVPNYLLALVLAKKNPLRFVRMDRDAMSTDMGK